MTETLLEFFKAMADESRLKIIGLLASGERNVQDLAQALGLREPTVSHHLAILRRRGLVTARADGTTRWHALDRAALERMAQRVLQPATLTEPVAEGADDWDTRVLAGYVTKEGRLKSIPASRKKRGAVLRWLMRDFESGRRYAEAEINDAIHARHWDSATLRRELIGHRMLAREKQVYWRLPEAEWRAGGEA
jgi:DNA-binding HxlR family transcriptional regulator